MKRTGIPGRRRRAGFTFVEILAALLFMAMVIPAIIGALSVANRAAEAAERSALAGELAQNKMSELQTDNAWQSPALTSGDFAGSYPGYRWEMSTEPWTGDPANSGMTTLHTDVHYSVQGVDHTVRLSTLVYVAATTATSGAGTAGTGAIATP